MVKVTHIMHDFQYGGISKLIFDIVSLQKENRFLKPQILVLINDGKLKIDFELLDIDIISIGVKSTYRFKYKHFKKVFNCFKDSNLLHFHGFHPYLCFLALLAKNKVLYTEHGLFGFGRKIRLKDRIIYKLRKIYYNNYVNIVACVSEHTRRFLINKWGLTKNNIKVVYNGVNGVLPPSKDKVEEIRSRYDNRFIIGISARLAGVKRIDIALESFKIFSEECKDSVLLIVGDGLLKVELEDYVSKNEIKNVYFLGYKSNMFEYQSAFDISILTSHNESFGIVAVESYLAKKPIIVFEDGGGLVEILMSNAD